MCYEKNLCVSTVLKAAPKITQKLPGESCAVSCHVWVQPRVPQAEVCSSSEHLGMAREEGSVQ